MLIRPSTGAGLVLLSALALHAAALPGRAGACSGLRCRAGGLLPTHMGKLPANAVELFWQPPVTFSEPASAPAPVHLYKLEGGTRSELAIDVVADGTMFRIKPKSAIAAGTELSFESEAPPCHGAEERTSFSLSVTPAAPTKPTRAGQLRIDSIGSRSLSLWVSSGECTLPFPVYAAELSFALDAEASPFAGVLRHSLIVDGVERRQYVPYPEYPRLPSPPDLGGALNDMIFTVCGVSSRGTMSRDGEKPGTHTVQWLTRLQDGTQLRSNELTIELACPKVAVVAVDGGVADASVDSGAEPRNVISPNGASDVADTGPARDSGSSLALGPDAGAAATDAPTTLGTAADDEASAGDDGCSLRAASKGTRRGTSLSWLFVALSVLAVRRRRRA